MNIRDKQNYLKVYNSITMNNLKKIINKYDNSIIKVATNCEINLSKSSIQSYISGQKIPSIPTLISLANYFNCNIDYLLDRTDISLTIKDIIEKNNCNSNLLMLYNNIKSLPYNKQKLVEAYVKGLIDSN